MCKLLAKAALLPCGVVRMLQAGTGVALHAPHMHAASDTRQAFVRAAGGRSLQ